LGIAWFGVKIETATIAVRRECRITIEAEVLGLLRMMQEKWSVDEGRAVEPTSGSGCDSSYLFKLSRGEERARSLVEFAAPSALTSLGFARQALAPYLVDDELPQRLIVDRDGKSRVV
jgi:hypothetical protein